VHPRDEIFFTTTPITVATNDGPAYGTGFFFRFCEAQFGTPAPGLVTNKHVLDNAQQVSFPLNVGNERAEPVPGQFHVVTAAIEECAVVDHPSADVDLCAILLSPFMDQVKMKFGQQTGLICATPDILAGTTEIETLRPLDSIVMIGYPLGLWDHKNNQPISRRGVLATRPALDFQGRPEFLIDLACFPGSSGSPIYVHDVDSYLDTDGGIAFGKGRTRLLGVLYAGPKYDAEGKLQLVPVPTSGIDIVTEVPTHLGVVIKAKEILELENPINTFVQTAG
jgi:hypothetical protein